VPGALTYKEGSQKGVPKMTELEQPKRPNPRASYADRLRACGEINAVRLPHTRNQPHFRGRGFSDSTIDALIDGGFEFPEQLLATEPRDLKKVKGIGPKALAEVVAYKEKFVR
jgi:hypothetical protein